MGAEMEKHRITMQAGDGPEIDITGAFAKIERANARPTDSVAADQLKAFIERIERLEEEKAGVAGDIKDVYAEAKGTGYDTKAIRKIVAMRKKDHAERQEEEAILRLYMEALGMLGDTPLGQAAIERERSKGGRR